MLNLVGILNQDRLIRAITGLNRKVFEELVPSFTEVYEQSLVKPVEARKRSPGGGRKATLGTPSEKLLYILLYCKCYPTFDLLSVLFDFKEVILDGTERPIQRPEDSDKQKEHCAFNPQLLALCPLERRKSCGCRPQAHLSGGNPSRS